MKHVLRVSANLASLTDVYGKFHMQILRLELCRGHVQVQILRLEMMHRARPRGNFALGIVA